MNNFLYCDLIRGIFMAIARKPVLRKPISRLRKGITGVLATAALLGAGYKAIAKERSFDRRPATSEQRMERKGLEERKAYLGNFNKEEYFKEAAIVLTSDPEFKMHIFNNMSSKIKREILTEVKQIYLKMRTAKSKREVLEEAKKKFGKYPVLLKAVLEGIARNQTFVK